MGTIGYVISWMVFGLIVGAIARAVYPGRQAMGLLMTMVLGVVGSLLGGFAAWMLTGGGEGDMFQGAGWIMSILGAIVVVWIGIFASKPKAIER